MTLQINLLHPNSVSIPIGRFERFLVILLPKHKILSLTVKGYGNNNLPPANHFTLKKVNVVERYKEN